MDGLTMSRLPESLIKRGTELAKTASFCGIPLDELAKEELLAAAALGWKAYNDHLEESIERTGVMQRIRGANYGS